MPLDKLEEVYCEECVYLKRDKLPPFTERCKHPHNWRPNWLKPVRMDPWDRNRNNDCKLVEKKRSAKTTY